MNWKTWSESLPEDLGIPGTHEKWTVREALKIAKMYISRAPSKDQKEIMTVITDLEERQQENRWLSRVGITILVQNVHQFRSAQFAIMLEEAHSRSKLVSQEALP
ncbi:TPA_asm: hypothetical protein vir519_00042 [Caudoviricetes sp. vir519]|nr:TPA_asm: hypothetical protein vir519_00042 [Caudoviricetes sp. vir519]